jgi:hypothetical protein
MTGVHDVLPNRSCDQCMQKVARVYVFETADNDWCVCLDCLKKAVTALESETKRERFYK